MSYEKLIYENTERGFQIKLVIDDFRDVEYLHLRKYFLSYDEGYIATKEGISIPATLENVYALLDGLIEICSKAEAMEILEKYYNKLAND